MTGENSLRAAKFMRASKALAIVWSTIVVGVGVVGLVLAVGAEAVGMSPLAAALLMTAAAAVLTLPLLVAAALCDARAKKLSGMSRTKES